MVPVAVIVMVTFKVPALPGLVAGVALGCVCALIFQNASLFGVFDSMMNGVTSETGHAMVDELLTRGGMQSMMGTISLIMCALTFGGVLEKTGMLACIAEKLLSLAKRTGSLILVTVISCLWINMI